MQEQIRPAAVAGQWYPGTEHSLAAAVEGHLAAASADVAGDLLGLIAPHAGLMYSGAVAARAYALLRGRAFDVVVLVGPSHFTAFDGVAIWPRGGFSTPLGVAVVDEACAALLMRATPLVQDHRAPHLREHALEMQLPFLQHLAPGASIVPLLVGRQTAQTASELGGALATVLRGRRALLVASTDLSHYQNRAAAAALDGVVLDRVSRFDADGLQAALEDDPGHACGGGAAVAVMRAARLLGARDARVLHYADSGDITGDTSSVVGYVAAAFGTFSN